MDHVRFAAVSLLFAALLAACTTPGGLQQDTAVLAGEIRFADTSPELQTYLQTHRAQGGGPVEFYETAMGTQVASTSYDVNTAGSNAPTPTGWKVGNYVATVPVNATGTQFLVVADPVRFDLGSSYRFGFRRSGTLASHVSSSVPPRTTATLDLLECAKMVPVRVRLVAASPGDLDPLTPVPNNPVACSVMASVQDVDQSPSFNQQALVSASFSVATATSATGGIVTFPVRAQRQMTRLSASCSVQVPPDSGYVVDNGGWVNLETVESDPFTLACADPGLTSPIDLAVSVRRSPMGDLRGLFDFVGYVEADAVVSASGRSTRPQPLPSEPPNLASWSIDRLPAGQVTAKAEGRVGEDMLLLLPFSTTLLSSVEVPSGGTLDLGSTFVVRPIHYAGKLVLVDPTGATGLSTLTTAERVDSGFASVVVAKGVDDAPSVPLGASAKGGLSTGRLHGPYTPEQSCLGIFSRGCWELDYGLLFSGLSPKDGIPNGSGTRETLWDVQEAVLRFGDSSVQRRQTLTLDFARAMRHTSREPGTQPERLDSVAACMGQIELDFVAEAATGLLHNPEFSHGDSTVSSMTTAILPTQIRSSRGWARGSPAEPLSSARAWVRAVVPEGASYELRPRVEIRLANASNSTTVTGLPAVRMPATGTLACGQVERACLKIDRVMGNTARALQVSIPNQGLCQPNGLSSLQFVVESNGEVLERVQYTIDGTSTTYCEGCVMSGSMPVTITQSLAAGTHTFVVTAAGSSGCIASSTYTFSACTPPPPVRQLAYFDEDRLNLVRLDTGLPVFPPVTVSGGAGPIRFNADGSRMAVRDPSGLRFFSTVDGSAQGGQAAADVLDFQYRPRAAQVDDRVALVPSPGNGPLVLRPVLGGVELAELAVPGTAPGQVVSIGRSRVAWSPDGGRIAVAATRSVGSEQKLLVTEWPVVGGALGPGVFQDWQILPVEALIDFAYEANPAGQSSLVLATTRSLYRAAGGFLHLIRREPLMRADLHRPSLWAIVPEANPTLTVLNLDVALLGEPSTGQVYGIAVSDYPFAEPTLAVARSATGATPGARSMLVYRLVPTAGGLPRLEPDRELPATRPHSPAFRGVGP